MADDEGERLDWGNDDDDRQPLTDSYSHSPAQSGDYAGVAEDAEDAVSLGGDDDEDRDVEDQDCEPMSKNVKTVKKEKIVKPVVPVPQQSQQGQSPQAGLPEKRKRGRPRKVPLPPVASALITM